MSHESKLGETDGVGLIVYTGSRDELQRKLRVRDDEITRLRAELAAAYEKAAKVADDEDGDLTTYGQDKNTALAQEVARNIASAIRSLAQEGK